MKVKILNLPENVEVFCNKTGSRMADVYMPDDEGSVEFSVDTGVSYDIYGSFIEDHDEEMRQLVFSVILQEHQGGLRSWKGHNNVWGSFGHNCLIMKYTGPERKD